MIKILFICLGNICRSPMAEFVMKDLVNKAGLSDRFEIASAATCPCEIGNPVYPNASKKLSEHGISCKGKTARQLNKSDYDYYDYLIAMEQENIRDIMKIIGDDPKHKVSLLLDYTDHPHDIADPWYTRDFELSWKEILEGCECLLKKLSSI